MLSDREQRIPIDTWITALVESVNIDIQSLVFSNNLLRVFVGIERVHKNQRHVCAVSFVQILGKTNSVKIVFFECVGPFSNSTSCIFD